MKWICYHCPMAEASAAWRILGRVQGVGFRYFVAREAFRLGLVGWTRNLPDGAVEVEARGRHEALQELERSLKAGPALSRVERLEPFPPSKSLERAASFTIEY
jgi:acylphosphatase